MVEEVTPDEVKNKLEEAQIVDIRQPPQYASGHIPNAINIPLSELPRRIGEHEWGDDIVVVCPIGQSSIQAARLIESFEDVDEDASVTSMAGGYDAWEYELETHQDDTEEVEI